MAGGIVESAQVVGDYADEAAIGLKRVARPEGEDVLRELGFGTGAQFGKGGDRRNHGGRRLGGRGRGRKARNREAG